jgi:hypothetical protein
MQLTISLLSLSHRLGRAGPDLRQRYRQPRPRPLPPHHQQRQRLEHSPGGPLRLGQLLPAGVPEVRQILQLAQELRLVRKPPQDIIYRAVLSFADIVKCSFSVVTSPSCQGCKPTLTGC